MIAPFSAEQGSVLSLSGSAAALRCAACAESFFVRRKPFFAEIASAFQKQPNKMTETTANKTRAATCRAGTSYQPRAAQGRDVVSAPRRAGQGLRVSPTPQGRDFASAPRRRAGTSYQPHAAQGRAFASAPRRALCRLCLNSPHPRRSRRSRIPRAPCGSGRGSLPRFQTYSPRWRTDSKDRRSGLRP